MAGNKVYSGQKTRISAADLNAWQDAARLAKTGQRVLLNEPPDPRSTTLCLVRNDSGADQERFAVLGLNGALISTTANLAEWKSRLAFKGILPVAGTHEGKFCVLLEPLADGKIGTAVVAGVVPVQITGAALTTWVEIANGVTTLAASSSGSVQVLDQEGGSGQRWALVRLGAKNTLTVKEVDGTPNVTNVATIRFGNGTVTNDGGGQVTVAVAALTVEEADGSPSYTAVSTLRFDQADGFVLTNPSAGVAKVDIAAATASQAGIVSTGAQTFGGLKAFTGITVFTQGSGYFAVGPGGVTGSRAVIVASDGTYGTFLQCNDGLDRLYLNEQSTGNQIATFSLQVDGGIGYANVFSASLLVSGDFEAAGDIKASTGNIFKVGSSDGITGTCTVKVAGVDKTLTFTGGIITGLA